jgi:hypothetical protein
MLGDNSFTCNMVRAQDMSVASIGHNNQIEFLTVQKHGRSETRNAKMLLLMYHQKALGLSQTDGIKGAFCSIFEQQAGILVISV